MTRLMRALPLLAGLPLGAAFALGACAHPAGRAPLSTSASLAVEIEALRTAARIPGLAVVVLRDTLVVLAQGFGYADVERRVAVTPETPFNIASVTKTISAVVALRLVERGLLDLDRPMTSYTGFAEFCADARAGGGIFFGDYPCHAQPFTLRHVLSMSANGVPGTRFLYNPPSYSWASRPMAQVGGASFSELTAAEVFVPAGMQHSTRIHRRLPLRPDLARELALPYHVDSAAGVMRSEPPAPQGDGAAGGVISTAMDLARFDIALTNGRLLSKASLKTMWSAGRAPSGAVLPYGIGWFVQQFEGETLLWHSGLWEGAYSALYLKAPARHLTIILLANSDGLRWENALDEAAVQRSPFVQALLRAFPRPAGTP